MRLKIRTRLMGLGLLGVIVALACGLAGLRMLERGDAQRQQQLRASAASVIEVTGERFHDALRADVLAAIMARAPGDRDQVRREANAHAQAWRAGYASLPTDPASRAGLAELQPHLDRYLELAAAEVELGTHDPAAAKAKLPVFVASFHDVQAALDAMRDVRAAANRKAALIVARDAYDAGALFVLVACFGAGLLLWGSWVVGRSVATSMSRAKERLRAISDHADLATRLAAAAHDVAEKGGVAVSNAVTAMGGISSASKRIEDILTTIDGLAYQANLLALSAAVEAARAGEQGHAFAGVATEVRALAQRSAQAARDTRGLVEDSVRKVEDGAQLVNRSESTLEEIMAAVRRVTDAVAEIAASSREDAVGVVTPADPAPQGVAARNDAPQQPADAAGRAAKPPRQAPKRRARVTPIASAAEDVTAPAPPRTGTDGAVEGF